jgi:3-hydroxymyristoyl/3-hydroxydecanoyl-(acyl carrier protein) dehydratase
MNNEARPAPLPHAYPFRFVDAVVRPAGPDLDATEGWKGETLARVSANARAAAGGDWGSPLLLAEAIAQAALLLQGGDPETGRRGFLAGIDGFEADRPPRAGETLSISVELSARFGAILKFQGEVRSEDGPIARGAVLVRRGEESSHGGS